MKIVSNNRIIFVFGSNLAGRHGKGAALCARQYYGAIYGQAEGLQGDSYAIPTKDSCLKTLPIERIKKSVERFISFAGVFLLRQPYVKFKVTPIGCGLAGYKYEDIAPLFKKALDLENIILPEEFITLLLNKSKRSKSVINAEIKEIFKYSKQGKSQRWIANKIGLHQTRISAILKQPERAKE